MKEIDKRVIKTKKQIKTTLIQLLMTKDIKDITIKELTDKAFIARKTFYLHYGCIIDVLNEIEKDIFKDLEKALENYISNNGQYEIKKIFIDLNEIINKDMEQYKKLALSDSYSKMSSMLENIISKIIISIITKVYNINTPHISYYAHFYSSGIVKLYMDWLKNNNISQENLTRICTRCCFNGVDQIIRESKKNTY